MALDKKQILGLVKQNVLTIVAAAVAVGAVAVPFVVANGKVDEASQKVNASAGLARDVDGVLGKSRKLPNLVPGAADAGPLEGFPTESAIKAGEVAVEHLTSQVGVMKAAAFQLNTYRRLVAEVFTEADGPRYGAAAHRFRDEYNKVMPAGLNMLVRGGAPYTAEEIRAQVDAVKLQIARERGVMQQGTLLNQAEITALQTKAEAEVPMKMRAADAARYAMFVSADAWSSLSASLPTNRAPSRNDVWMAQLGLWIQEDVAGYINALNKNSKSVLTSPVKHLVKVAIPERPYATQSAPAGDGTQGGSGVPVTKVDPAGTITLNRSASLTGRLSNSVYDVVHYQLVIRVRESDVTTVLAELPRGRLHYVLGVDMRSIDSPSEATMGYVYGNDPVVELTIRCEALFLREWTQQWMPRGIKVMVGMEEAPPPTQQP
jgi:hypothetical protein